jgi:hypothetical protein
MVRPRAAHVTSAWPYARSPHLEKSSSVRQRWAPFVYHDWLEPSCDEATGYMQRAANQSFLRPASAVDANITCTSVGSASSRIPCRTRVGIHSSRPT